MGETDSTHARDQLSEYWSLKTSHAEFARNLAEVCEECQTFSNRSALGVIIQLAVPMTHVTVVTAFLAACGIFYGLTRRPISIDRTARNGASIQAWVWAVLSILATRYVHWALATGLILFALPWIAYYSARGITSGPIPTALHQTRRHHSE